MIENGASKESFDTILTSGPNSSLPHAVPQDKKLEQPVLVDWGAIYEVNVVKWITLQGVSFQIMDMEIDLFTQRDIV